MHIFSGKYKNRILKTPKGLTTRPTSGRMRETFFNICQGYIEGADFLDLFAGSGAMGLEALSRGARSATFVDSDKSSCQCIRQNIDALKIESHVLVLCGDVFHWLEKLAKQGKQFDIIYADPPYETKVIWKGEGLAFSDLVIKLVDEYPLLKTQGELFVEDSSGLPPYKGALSHLKLKNSRQHGRSALQQYAGTVH